MKKYRIFLCVLLALFLTAAAFVPASGAADRRVIARGDADFDGKLQASDARTVLRCAVGLGTAPVFPESLAFDVDRSGKIDSADARLVLRGAVGLELLSFQNNFYLPLTVAEGDAFSVILTAVFSDGPVHGLVFDLVNRSSSLTLEFCVNHPAINGFMTACVNADFYMGASTAIDETLLPGEFRSCALVFDQDLVDPSWFLDGLVQKLQLTVDVFNVTNPGLPIMPSLFNGVCDLYPNRAYPAGGRYLQYPYDNDEAFWLPGQPFAVAQNWMTYIEAPDDGDPGLIDFVTERAVVCNLGSDPLYVEFADATLCGDTPANYGESASDGVFLYPGANALLRLDLNVRPLHIYRSDLVDLQFRLRVTNARTQEILYDMPYSVFFPTPGEAVG